MVIVYKDFKFDSAHSLYSPKMSEEHNREVFGKCFNTHGHTYKLRIGLKGDANPKTGLVINFADLKAIINEEIIEELDHKHLNSVDMFDGVIPTAENMVEIIWHNLKRRFSETSFSLYEVTLWETETSFVTKRADIC